MNDKTNFDIMLSKMWDMQVPIITVECVGEKYYNEYHMASHIIIPDGVDRVTDFIFIDTAGKGGDFLASVHSLSMNFKDAISDFSLKVLRSQGGVMKLYSN